MKQKYNGFTLIELMVSVALMLIIIGMTMVIFNSTSTTFTVAEAKVDIMQNARLALDTIAKDIANATEISGNTITTVASYWVKKKNSTTTEKFTGKVKISYSTPEAISFNGNQLYFLYRKIQNEDLDTNQYEMLNADDNTKKSSTSTIAEYLVRPIDFEFFLHSGNKDTDWEEAQLGFPNGTELPPLVRVTITVTDEHMNACRTLSRTIWIPKGIRRPTNE